MSGDDLPVDPALGAVGGTPPGPPAGRVTIADIARRVGVTKGAVSYALNGKPGVSAATRQRVLDAARDLRWTPHSAARSLAGHPTSTIGLVVTRPAETLGDERYLMAFVGGLQSSLQQRRCGLLLQVARGPEEELATYRLWAGERRADGVVVLDPAVDDPRPAALVELRLPAVVVGMARREHGQAGVRTDDAAAVEEVVGHLADLGHRELARVAGPRHLGHTAVRDDAFAEAVRRRGGRVSVVHTDYSGPAGARATAELVSGPDAPTAVVYDSDLMAVAGLSRLAGMGLRVPDDVSLVAWDDSPTCEVTHPALTATGYDVVAFGRSAGEALFALLDGAEGHDVAPVRPRLHVRASTGPPPDRRRPPTTARPPERPNARPPDRPTSTGGPA